MLTCLHTNPWIIDATLLFNVNQRVQFEQCINYKKEPQNTIIKKHYLKIIGFFYKLLGIS